MICIYFNHFNHVSFSIYFFAHIAGRVRPNPGRIADYDPAEVGFGGGGTPYSNRNSAGARQVYDSNIGRGKEHDLVIISILLKQTILKFHDLLRMSHPFMFFTACFMCFTLSFLAIGSFFSLG